MKELLLIPICLFFVGCTAEENYTTRGQFFLGMSFGQAWMAYNKQIPETVSEETNGQCITTIYRFWLRQDDYKPSLGDIILGRQKLYLPYLLTFVSYQHENFEEIVAERKARVDAAMTANPQLAEDIEKLCKKENINLENREMLIELLFPDAFAELPQPRSEPKLTKIEVDYQMLDRISQQNYQNKTLQLQRQHLKLKQERLNEIGRQNLLRNLEY